MVPTTTVRLTVGSKTAEVRGAVARTVFPLPIIGLPALQKLAPHGVTIHWKTKTVSLFHVAVGR